MSRGTERFPVVETPAMLPGNCFLCSGIKGPFIDTRIQKPIIGHFYICFDCVKEMFGMFPQPEVVVEPEPERITKEEYEATIHGLRDNLLGPINSLLGALSAVPSLYEPPLDAELSLGDEGTKSSADKSPENPSEPVGVEGPSGLSSDRSDESGADDPFNL